MRFIETEGAPRAAGHYSQAVVHQGVVYVAGQLPIDPADRDAPHGDPAAQTERCLRNVEANRHAAGSSLNDVLQMTVYVSDIAHWPAVNAAYARVMGGHRPARAIVPVKELNHDYMIEIQAIARVLGE